ncbi:MAG: 50S ribosomal protein L19 [Candidatus Omnitrophota bacterium]
MDRLKLIEQEYIKKDVPKFNVGDTVKVLTKISEGQDKDKDKDKNKDKVRLHPFEGLVIAKQGSGIRVSFTVRKISYGEGIERVFSLYSPNIERIDVLRSGKVKRAKLYYLRGKVGKQATKIESKESKPQ